MAHSQFKYILVLVASINVLCLSAATDFFGIDKLTFDGKQFFLNWSAISPNDVYIEDFLPAKSSITRFNDKFSVYYQDSTDFSKLINQKKKELSTMKLEQQIDTFYVDESNPNDVIIDYVSELNQGGTVFVAQYTLYRFINNKDYVLNYEYQQRSYTKTSQFVNKAKSNRIKRINEIRKFSLPKSIHLIK